MTPIAITATCVALIGYAVVLAALGEGGILGSWRFLLAVSALLAIPWYFGTRDRNRPPSTLETALAWVWIWFRRVTLGLVAGFCFLIVHWIVFVDVNPLTWQAVLGAAAFAAVGVVVMAIAVFGFADRSIPAIRQGYLANRERYSLRRRRE